MAMNFQRLKTLQKLTTFRTLSSGGTTQPGGSQKPPAPSAGASGNVPGLSKKVVTYGSEPVGPGAAKNTNYKNPEYFCYDQTSYFEAELEMAKYRCPQPSSIKK